MPNPIDYGNTGDTRRLPAMDGCVKLSDILDASAIQAMMDAFFSLTKISVSVIDIHGKVLATTGWQDICTKFHRIHPETHLHCIESDTELSAGIKPGTFKKYRCKNGMWNVATPIVVDGKKVGNLFLSQFLFENETPDHDAFRSAAKRYGFDEMEYLEALDRVPRWSQETIKQAMNFYIQFANLVSTLSFSNNRLELTVAERTQELMAANEELVAQNEEITAMNEEIASLNQNLTGLNEELEQRVVERTADLTATHEELTTQYEELREIQEILSERETRYFDLVSNLSDGIALRDEAGLIIHANSAFADMVQIDEVAKVLGIPYLDFVHPEDRAETLRRVALNITGTSVTWREHRLVGVHGRTIFVESTGVSMNQGGQHQIMGVFHDVTERKQAQDALSESEARYRSVIEQSPEAVLLIDTQTGNVIEANSRFTERFGYEPVHLGALNLFDLIVDDPEKIRLNITRIGQLGSLPIERRSIRHHNGCIVSVERSAALVSYQGRRLFVMTMRDVSEEVRREQEIRRDAQLAARVQNALLSVPEPSEYLKISTVYQPSGYVGGDLYFINWRYGGSLLRGFLVDSTGHGLGTALHTASMHVLIREVNELDLPLTDAMNWLNRRAGEYFDEGTFAGALGFELDLQIRQLRWVCAGIPKILVATKTKQGAVECPGMCLGISENETFETHTMPIEIGDCFYFMTDGLTDLLQGRTNLPLDRHSAMLDLLWTLSEAEDRRDDATAVCIRVCALPQALIRQDGWPNILRLNGYGDYQRLKDEVAKILAEVTGRAHSLAEVAVNEAIANALECRDGQARSQKARVKFNKVGNRFIVRVKTSRIGFAGNAILRRLRSHPEDMFSFGEDASMGRGIPMMLSMSHKMTYNSEGTEVLLA